MRSARARSAPQLAPRSGSRCRRGSWGRSRRASPRASGGGRRAGPRGGAASGGSSPADLLVRPGALVTGLAPAADRLDAVIGDVARPPAAGAWLTVEGEACLGGQTRGHAPRCAGEAASGGHCSNPARGLDFDGRPRTAGRRAPAERGGEPSWQGSASGPLRMDPRSGSPMRLYAHARLPRNG